MPVKTAELVGKVLTDLETGLRYKLDPSPQDVKQGILQYYPEIYSAEWAYLRFEGKVYAINPAYMDWDDNKEEWNPNEMGEWPFGNKLSEEEKMVREALSVLTLLDYYLDDEIEWMDRIEEQENEEPEDDDSDDDYDPFSDDEGYDTSPEVDYEQFDFWALGKCSLLWRIGLYKDDGDGWWTL